MLLFTLWWSTSAVLRPSRTHPKVLFTEFIAYVTSTCYKNAYGKFSVASTTFFVKNSKTFETHWPPSRTPLPWASSELFFLPIQDAEQPVPDTLRIILSNPTGILQDSSSKSTSCIVKIHSPIRYLDFTNVSHTSVTGPFLPDSDANSRKSAENILMVLILRPPPIPKQKTAVELLWTPRSVACAFWTIVIFIPSRTTYCALLSTLTMFSSFRPSFLTYSVMFDSALSLLLSIMFTVCIALLRILLRTFLYTGLMHKLKCSYLVMPETNFVPNLCISSIKSSRR